MRKLICLVTLFSYLHAQQPPIPDTPSAMPPLEDTAAFEKMFKNIIENTEKTKTTKKETKPVPAKKTTVRGPDTQNYSEEEIGIQGSWRKKKDWLQQTLDTNDSLQDISNNVLKFKAKFYDQFKKIDSSLDTFYRNVGLNREKFLDLFKQIDKDIGSSREKTKRLFTTSLANLTDEMKEEVRKIKTRYNDAFAIDEEFRQQENALKQLKLDAKNIADLDAAIKNRLKAVDQQVETVGKKADEADRLSKKIWYIIDDTKAKKLFYKVKDIHRNAKNLKTYITSDLFKDFEKIIKITQAQIETTNESIQNIEKHGIIITNRTKRLEKQHKKQLEEMQKIKLKQKKPRHAKIIKLSWYEQIFSAIFSIFDKIKSFIKSYFG
jgi:hypothetical protein